jgi:malate dehydrogenase (oxaloacetate-decarboxylating)
MTDYNKEALKRHEEFKGKIGISLKDKVDNKEALSIYYTPGVAAVSDAIAKDESTYRKYTWVANNLAVISNGTAVLGLGDIGPKASMPVMEGKSMLFKQFANIDAVPIVLNSKNPREFVKTVIDIAPSFAAINLEDIAAPECFEIEDRLVEALNIPVMHDDQHGTAIVVLAGLINSAKIVNKEIKNMRIVLVGSGAAGTAISKLIHSYAPDSELLLVDSKGIISSNRGDLNDAKKQLLEFSNKNNIDGDLKVAIKNADVFIGVSKGNLLTSEDISSMNKDAIIFAMANPTPEILPDQAKAGGARIVATGRSDFPNQVNNALAFPGIFRGALDNNVTKITTDHKLRVAEKIASLVENPNEENIIPSIFQPGLAEEIAKVFAN